MVSKTKKYYPTPNPTGIKKCEILIIDTQMVFKRKEKGYQSTLVYKPKTQVQTLTRTYMVVVEDFDHMKTMNENVHWMKLTHLLSIFPLNLRTPCCTSTFTS